MTKRRAIEIISQAAKVYYQNFINQKMLIIFGDASAPKYIEVIGSASNFLHLTGMELNNSIPKNTTNSFFNNALDGKLNENEFEFKNTFSEQKLKVIVQTLNIGSNASMIGDYGDWRINLKSNKLAGGQNSFLGLVKQKNIIFPTRLWRTIFVKILRIQNVSLRF